MDLSLSTLGNALEVKIEFNDTKTEDNTPAAVPTSEKLISPLMPSAKPRMTIKSVEQVIKLVVFPKNKYVNITLKTIDKLRATLSILNERS